MKLRYTLFIMTAGSALLLFLASPVSAQQNATLRVTDAAICGSVEDMRCVDPGERFNASVGKLFCFTRINGAADATEVAHVWYFGDQERFRITLPVRSASFRTYSSKTIQAHETGSWHVDVVGPDGSVIETVKFTVAP